MQKNFKLFLLIIGLFFIAGLIAFVKQSNTPTPPSHTVFNCTLNKATLNVTAQGKHLVFNYATDGQDITIKGDASSENINYRHEMWSRAEDKQLRFRSGDDSYVIFNRWAAASYEDTPEIDYSGLLTFKGLDQIDVQFCQDGGVFSTDYDFSTLPDDGKDVIPEIDTPEAFVMDNIDQLDDINHDDLLPGAYRDEHGCIPSAGYEWSEEKQSCIRPWLEETDISDETIQEIGLIKTVEDGVYPMFVVTMAFPKRGFEQAFDLNVEQVDIDDAALTSAIGNYASFTYTSELKPRLVEMVLDGKPITGTEIPSSLETFTGTLSGAESVTKSDLPGQITVTDNAGKQQHFAYYVPQEMLAANGKEVTVYYWLRTENNIVDISLE